MLSKGNLPAWQVPEAALHAAITSSVAKRTFFLVNIVKFRGPDYPSPYFSAGKCQRVWERD